MTYNTNPYTTKTEPAVPVHYTATIAVHEVNGRDAEHARNTSNISTVTVRADSLDKLQTKLVTIVGDPTVLF